MTSAIEQVLLIFQSRFIESGLNAQIHRDENEILQSSEYPVVAIAWGGCELESPSSCDQYLWRSTVIFDCWAQVELDRPTISQCADQISIIAAIIREDYSFGGKLQECIPISVSDFANIGGDTGCITLVANVLFTTSRGDFNTLI